MARFKFLLMKTCNMTNFRFLSRLQFVFQTFPTTNLSPTLFRNERHLLRSHRKPLLARWLIWGRLFFPVNYNLFRLEERTRERKINKSNLPSSSFLQYIKCFNFQRCNWNSIGSTRSHHEKCGHRRTATAWPTTTQRQEEMDWFATRAYRYELELLWVELVWILLFKRHAKFPHKANILNSPIVIQIP